MKADGNIGLQGDFGTIKGRGKLSVPGMQVVAYGDAISALQTYHAALVSAQLTGTNIAQCAVTYNDEISGLEPLNNINIDRKMIVLWHTTTNSTTRKQTISGVPATSTSITPESGGERLNQTGRGLMAAALEAVYGLGAGTVIVEEGYLVQAK